jgi:dienelactone hydrolase
MAGLGEDLTAVVSFHGILDVVPPAGTIQPEILVCHGGDDQFVPEAQVAQFKRQMDSVGAKYTFTVYDGATHAFTNPAATENGKKFNIPIAYNAAADTASWKEMQLFFDRVLK